MTRLLVSNKLALVWDCGVGRKIILFRPLFTFCIISWCRSMLLLAFSLIFVISFVNWLSGTGGRRINEAETSRRPLEVLLLSRQPSELLGISRGSRLPSSEGAPGSSPNSVSERYFVGVSFPIRNWSRRQQQWT
jgi:hypothetical protein